MKPIVSEWLHVARTDLLAAEKLCLDEDLTNIVCFHAQQCVEKCLKAILEDNDLIPPKTHDLIRLYAMVEDIIEIDEDMLARLNELYIDSRYPAEFCLLPYGKPTVKDAKRFYDFARMTYEITTNIIEG